MTRSLLIVCVLAFPAQSTFSHDLGGDVRSWVDQQVIRGPSFESLKNVEFTVAVEKPYVKSQGDKSRVFGLKPNDPHTEQRLYHVWWSDTTNWRVSIDHPRQPKGFTDVCESDKGLWRFDAGNLTLVKSVDGFPLQGDFRPLGKQVLPIARTCISGTLAPHPSGASKVLECQVDSNAKEPVFKADVRQSDGVTMRYQGRWVADRGRGFVETVTVLANDSGAGVGMSISFSDWEQTEVPSIWAAKSVRIKGVDGRLSSAYVGATLLQLDTKRCEEVLAAPAGGTDAIRGTIAIAQVMDYRSTRPVATYPGRPEIPPVLLPSGGKAVC